MQPKTTKSKTVELYEDNAGGLYLRCGNVIYADIEQSQSCLAADAAALAAGDTEQWTVERLDRPADPRCSDGSRTHYWNAEDAVPDGMAQPDADSDLASCLKCGVWAEHTASGEAMYWRDADAAIGEARLIATWTDGNATIRGKPGNAGRSYIAHEDASRNLYDQRPPSEGRKLVPRARLCEACGALRLIDRA